MDQNITASPPASAPTAEAAPPAPSAGSPPGSWSPGLVASAILVAILAFLVGSFRVTNADIWLTLGTGKLIAAGQYQFGVDPFSWASAGSYWANPSWLSSWFAYVIYQNVGSSSLVVLKALLIVMTAGFVFAARSKDSALLPSLELTALAIVAASPRFLLQSTVISFAALAALILLLTRSGFFGGLANNEKTKQCGLWQIPLLFLAWSNLDAFFILGLAVVALVAVGLATTAETRTEAKRLAIILCLSIAASALNPHLFANFTLPTEIAYLFQSVLPASWTAAGHTAAAFNDNDTNFYLVISPFSSDAIGSVNINFNIAGLLFYLLVIINIGSFVAAGFVPGKKRFAARGLVCLAFGLLMAFQIRLVPFYAIVAAPLTILNFTDYARWSRLGDTLPRGGVRFARLTTFAFLLVAVFLAWPGWLHLGLSQFHDDALFHSHRRVEWNLEPEPSLHRTALSLKEGAASGQVHNVLNFVPEIAHYCAFFAPEAKCGVDLRLALFAPKARDYAALRNEFWSYAADRLNPKAEQKEYAWPKTLDDWKIDTLVLTNYNRAGPGSENTGRLAYVLLQQPTAWKPTVADGQTLAFGYSAGRAWPDDYLFSVWRRAAFAPHPESTWLPDDSPLIPPREMNWLDLYSRGFGQTPYETSAAVFEFESSKRYSTIWLKPYFEVFQAMHILPAAGHAGAVPGHVLGLHAAHVAALGELVFRRPAGNEATWFHSVDQGPAALPILVARDLRRSIDKNPNIAATHALLAQTVKLKLQQETWWNRQQTPMLRMQLRKLELIAALRNAANLAPQNPDYHRELAEALYAQNYLDAALVQLGEAIKALDSIRAGDLQQRKAVLEHREQLETNYKRLEFEIKKRRDDLDIKAAGAPEMDRFRIAVRNPWRFTDLENRTVDDPRGRGLALEGLRILERINPANLTADEKIERNYYLVRLNCFQGKIQEAVDIFKRANNELGDFNVECMAWIAAATGWYKKLDETIGVRESEVVHHLQRQTSGVVELACNSLLVQFIDQPMASHIVQGYFTEQMMLMQREELAKIHATLADFRTLRGIYAVERGDVVRALVHFDQALAEDVVFHDWPIAQRYSQLLRQEAGK